MRILEVLHRILDARGVSLTADEWSEVRLAVREERTYAVMRYMLEENGDGKDKRQLVQQQHGPVGDAPEGL